MAASERDLVKNNKIITDSYDGFERIVLDDEGACIWRGVLPEAMRPDAEQMEALWALHPPHHHLITMHGKQLETPRWEQAYGADYEYAGGSNAARDYEPMMVPWMQLLRERVDARLNGAMLTWYDGGKRHYIGAHRDDTRALVTGTSVVMISFGEERIFRMRPWKGKRPMTDVEVGHGTIIVLPWETNATHTHEVPHFARQKGRRVSMTARAFRQERFSLPA